MENKNKITAEEVPRKVERKGWDVPLSQPIPESLKCPLCSLLTRNPIQTINGARACESCYFGALVNSSGICPIDKKPIKKEECFRDRFAQKEVGKIKCFCSFKENGCPWEGIIAEVEIHQSDCTYQPSTILHSEIKMKEDLANLQRQINGLKSEITDIRLMDNHDPRFDKLQRELHDIDLKQRLYENTSYDGRIIWKINNLNFRMQQAVIGHAKAIHSAPCYTEKYGYRFCGRLYLNGDGIGKSTHVSVFFVLMKSEYDNILQWPFTKRVKFRLINQGDASRSRVESFIPDQFSKSFQKPVCDMNVASGCPMFISKDELLSNGFVKDNVMFLEITVENVVQKQPVEDACDTFLLHDQN